MGEEFIMVMTTTGKKQDAEVISRTLVEKRLAGCVQVLGPMTSTYEWKGNIETAEEWLCLIKTGKDNYPEFEKTIKTVHPYETPEIIAVPIVAGSAEYLEWLDNVLGS